MNYLNFFTALAVCFFLSSSILFSQGTYCPEDHYNCPGVRVIGQGGLGYTFGKQEQRWYLYMRGGLNFVDFGHDWRGLKEWRKDLIGHKAGLLFEVKIFKNLELYDLSFRDVSEKQSGNWTFRPSIEFILGLRPKNKSIYYEARYALPTYQNTGYFRKLSNITGRVRLTVAHYAHKGGVSIEMENDFLRGGSFSDPKSDHGETQRAGIEFFYFIPGNETFWDDLYFSAGYSEQMITDRRESLEGGDYNAIYGKYRTLKDIIKNAYHYYQTVDFKLDLPYYHGHLKLGEDDLIAGRNRQRFIHQGMQHRNKSSGKQLRKLGQMVQINSPLFPWESQATFIQKPKKYFSYDSRLQSPRMMNLIFEDLPF